MEMSSFATLLLDSLLKNEYLSASVIKLVQTTTKIALIIAPLFYILSLGWNYLKSGYDRMVTGKPGPPVDLQQLGRSIVIMFFIISYSAIISAFDSTIMYINSLSAPNSEQVQEMAAELQSLNKKAEKDMEVKEKVEDGIFGFMSWDEIMRYLDPKRFLLMSFGAIVQLLAMLIKIIVGGIAGILYKFMLVVGPLAAAFSIFPFQRSKLEEWAGTTINAGLVFTTFNLLDHLLHIMMYNIFHSPHLDGVKGFTSYHLVMVVHIVVLVLYLCAFWLTSKYVGKGDVGRAAGKLVGLAASAAAASLSAGAGVAGAVAKGGGPEAVAAGKKEAYLRASSDLVNRTGDAFKDE